MFVLLSLIEQDPLIVDIRWAAYMLATVMKEILLQAQTVKPVAPVAPAAPVAPGT